MKIEKKSTSQLIVEQILDQIEDGDLKSGDKLPPEREYAESLGVSRMPLREAVCALSVMGVLETRQGGGNYIADYQPRNLKKILQTYACLSDSFLGEMLEARLYTESISAKMAAKNATEHDLEKIREAVEKFHQAVREIENGRFDFQHIIELDEMVHLGFAAAAHNSFFLQFIDLLHQSGYAQGDIRRTYEQHRDYFTNSDEFHHKIFDAIARHDEDAAYVLMFSHISDIRESVHGNAEATKTV